MLYNVPLSERADHIIALIMDDYEDYNYEEDNGEGYDYDYDQGEGQEMEVEVPGEYDNRGYSQQQYQQGVQSQVIEVQPFEILPLQRIFQELMHILGEIHDVVYLDLGWCLRLLRLFKWDKEYLKEEYYNKNEQYLKKVGFSPNFDQPSNIKNNIGMCMVCCQENIMLCSNICGHEFCIECWFGHIKSSINQRGANIPCMDSDCPAPLLLESVQAILRDYGAEGRQWLKRYEKKLCEMFITTNKNYQFCTGLDCNNCIKVNALELETVQCVCGKVFCFRCQSDDHYPCHCDEKEKWIQQVVKEQADMKWISQNAKICPFCKKAVERAMGCNFISCTCGKNFCYMCSQPWEPDHKDHFKCHIYKKRPEQEVNKEKEILERMNHCTERYLFNQQVANNYRNIDVFAKRKYLFRALKLDLTESEFMEAAYKFAIECCTKLKWIYAFTYFHQMKESKQRKDSFEFSLGEYEKYKENLLKMLAIDLKQFMEQIEKDEKEGQLTPPHIEYHLKRFHELKKLIVNYYTCTKNYKEAFVKEVAMITKMYEEEREKKELQSYMVPDKMGNRKSKGSRDHKAKKKEETTQSSEKGSKKKEGGLMGFFGLK